MYIVRTNPYYITAAMLHPKTMSWTIFSSFLYTHHLLMLPTWPFLPSLSPSIQQWMYTTHCHQLYFPLLPSCHLHFFYRHASLCSIFIIPFTDYWQHLYANSGLLCHPSFCDLLCDLLWSLSHVYATLPNCTTSFNNCQYFKIHLFSFTSFHIFNH